jgi:simple sugar transport system substrate-binding protein
MKKVLILVLSIIMVASLALLTACSTPAPQPSAPASAPAVESSAAAAPSESAQPSEAPAKKYKIATVVKLVGIGWFDRMEEGLKKFAADTGHETFMQGPPKADAALQVQIIEDLIAQKVDAICVVPFSPEAVEPVLKKAREKGIVVIGHEADNLVNVDFDIEAFDNKAYGAELMKILGDKMGGEGKYATTVGAVTAKSQNQWEEGGVEYQEANFKNMQLVERKIETYDEQKKAEEIMTELLKKYPDLKGFQGATSQDAPGAAAAVEKAGLIGKVHVVGTSLVSIAGKYLESGALDAIAFWDPADAGYAMNKLATMILDGKKDQIKEGLDLGVPGYEKLIYNSGITENKEKYLYGAAWKIVTKENMGDYNF